MHNYPRVLPFVLREPGVPLPLKQYADYVLSDTDKGRREHILVKKTFLKSRVGDNLGLAFYCPSLFVALAILSLKTISALPTFILFSLFFRIPTNLGGGT